jgi:hypothetical protein
MLHDDTDAGLRRRVLVGTNTAQNMTEPVIYIYLAILGSVAGAFSTRAPASGLVSFVMPILPLAALYSAMGRR